jgi:hypothetical protein
MPCQASIDSRDSHQRVVQPIMVLEWESKSQRKPLIYKTFLNEISSRTNTLANTTPLHNGGILIRLIIYMCVMHGLTHALTHAHHPPTHGANIEAKSTICACRRASAE